MEEDMIRPRVCVYDNPSTMCREGYINGKVVAHISARLMYLKGFDGFPELPFYLNVDRKFEPGRVIGNTEALRTLKEALEEEA